MRNKLLAVAFSGVFIFSTAVSLRAEQLIMQNGDRYFGKVISVSPETVVWDSEVLGQIEVPRNKVMGLAFSTNAIAPSATSNPIAPIALPSNLSGVASPTAMVRSNENIFAALQNLGGNTNFIRQIREQMLSGNPEAAGKFDTLVNGLITGKLNLNDLRREARSSVDQLRALKKDLGPEVDDSLNAYLDVLDSFLKETSVASPATPPAPPQKASGR